MMDLWENISDRWSQDVQIKYYREFNIEELTDEKNPTKTLESGCKVLENLGLKYWISQGTLLGFYRDKNFIEGDSDIDIEILDVIDESKFQDIVENLPFDIIRSASLYDKYMQLAFIDPTNNVIFDLWFLYSKDDVILNYTDDGKLHYPKEYFENLSTIDFKDKHYPSPSDSEWYCKFRYGDDWNIPQYKNRHGKIK